MDDITFYTAAGKGTKNIALQDVPTAKATGFNAAADDYMERGIDLNEQLVSNKPATYFFRMNGDAMIGAGIKNGDILIVDRSLPAVNEKIIVAVFDGEFIVRRLQKLKNSTTLLAENMLYSSLVVNEYSSYSAWGVVTYIIQTV